MDNALNYVSLRREVWVMGKAGGKGKKQGSKSWKFWLIFVIAPIIVVACSSLVVYGLYVKNRFSGKTGYEKGLIYANLNRYTEAIEEFEEALVKRPDDANIHYHIGTSYLKLRKYDKATTALLAALTFKPDFTDVHIQLAAMKLENALELRRLGKKDALVLEKLFEAEDICKEVLDKEPDFVRAHILLGKVHFAQGSIDEAIADYKKAVSIDNKLVDAHIALVKLLLQEDKTGLAERQCKTALSVVGSDNYQIQILLSTIYDKQGKFDEAIEVAKQILGKKPDDFVAHTQLSILYLKTSKFDEAFSEAEKAINSGPSLALPPIVYFVKGRVLLQKKDYINAVAQLSKVTKSMPNLADAHYFLAIALMEMDRKEQAKSEFKTAIRLAPESVHPKVVLANLFARDGELREAISLGKDVLYLEPGNVNAMQVIGMAYLKLGKVNEAERQFNEINKLNPSIADISMAYLSLELGQLSKCIRQCEDIIKINPNSAKVHNILGNAYVKRREFDKGIEQFLKAIEIDRGSTNSYLSLSNAYIMVQDFADAIKTLEKLISLTPRNISANIVLANLYKNDGNIDKAINIFEKVVEIKPDYLPRTQLAGLYLLKGDTDKSIYLFDKALGFDPENALLYNDFAVAYQQNNNFAASIEYSKKAIGLKPEIPSFRIIMANLYTTIGEVDKAKEQVDSISLLNDDEKNEYKGLIDLCQSDVEKGKQVTLAINRAIVARQNSIFNLAIDECKKAAKIFPDNLIPKILLADTYLSSGQNEEAINLYNEIVENNPEFASSYRGLGKAYLLSEKQDEAIAIYKGLVDIDSESVSARLTLARLLLKQGSIDEAVEIIGEATEIDPENVMAHNMLAKANLKGSWHKKAENEFLEMLKLDSGTFEAHFNLAKIKLNDGDVDGCIEHCKAGLKIRPVDVRLHNILGMAYGKKGMLDMATAEFNKIIDINSDFTPAYLHLAQINLKTKKPKIAVSLYKAALNIDSANVGARWGLGNAYLTMGKHQDAIDQFNSLKEDHPENAQVYSSLANSYMTIGDYKKAREMITKAVEIKPESNVARNIQAKIYIMDDDIPAAINLLESLLRDNPKFADAYTLGILYIDIGEYDKAIETYKQGMDNFPQNTSMLSNLAVAYLMKQEYEKAKDVSSRAYNIKRSGVTKNLKEICEWLGSSENRSNDELNLKVKKDYHISRAMAYLNNKWFKRALREYDEIIKILPSDKTAYNTKADILTLLGEYDGAIETFKKVIELEPESQDVYRKLATIYVRAGRMEDAELQFRKASDMAPDDVQAQVNLGIILQSNDQVDESIKAYKRAIKIEPSATAYNNLAWLYTFHKKDGEGLEDAVMFAKKAKELSGDNAHIIDTLGWAYYLNGRYDEALPELSSAVNKIPWNPTVRYHLGMAYYRKGMLRLALNEMEKAIDIDEAFPEADEARALIKEITGAE
ncbi:MAG: tetratricopeptide repeat protein [Candidatus Anammoxibacter sp.]